jgi:uncharacterized membrane protein
MSQLVVLGFDTEEQALDALKSLRRLEKDGRISFEDTAVVTHRADGKMEVKNEASSATETGAAVGAVLGGFVTFMFPVAGIAVGAIVGGGIGSLMGRGVSGDFVKDVKEELAPGKSALFALVKGADRNAALAVLREFHGEVIQTTLDEDAEQQIRDALK